MNIMAIHLKPARVVCGLFIGLLFTVLSNQAVNAGAVAGGESHSIALKNDGTVWGWGANGGGQIGNGEVGDNQLEPVQVIALTGYLTDITAIAAGTSYWLNQGGHNLALKNDGTVWAWGAGLEGQLGDGAGISRSIPVQVVDETDPTGYLTDITAIGAGDYHSIAAKNDGTVWTWGDNGYGQIGDGTNEPQFTAVQVTGLANVSAVTGGGVHTLALKNDETVWAWGANGGGQLGNQTIGWPASMNTPVQVHDLSDPTGYLTDISAIEAGDEHSLALKNDGTVYAWGGNPFGQLGDGTWGWPESKTSAVQVADPADPTGYLTNVIAIAGGDDYSLALKADGKVWGFGRNNWGQLGNGTYDDTNIPVQVSGLSGVISIAAGNGHSLAIKADGSVWTWGGNWAGQLGDGTLEGKTTPVQINFLDQADTNSLLTLRGSYFVTTGEEVTYVIIYENILEEVLIDTVVVLSLPGDFSYVSSTQNGIYNDDSHQVVWKLGNLDPADTGHLTVKMEVPWGLSPHSLRDMAFDIGAENLTSRINSADYIDLAENPVSEKDLTSAEINAHLTSDNDLKALLDYAEQNLGYVFSDSAQQLDFVDGSSLIIFALLDPEDFGPVFLHKAEDSPFIEKFDERGYSLLTTEGGFTLDLQEESFESWGSWAESNSQAKAKCVNVCLTLKPVLDEGKQKTWQEYIRDEWKFIKSFKRLPCRICKEELQRGRWNGEQCLKCVNLYFEDHKRKIKASEKRGQTPPKGNIWGKVVDTCLKDCIEGDTNKWQCTDHLYYCSVITPKYGLDLSWDEGVTVTKDLVPAVVYDVCIKTSLGSFYAHTWVQEYCDSNEICKATGPMNTWCRSCSSQSQGKSSTFLASYSGPTCWTEGLEVLTAHDPNAKHAAFTGDVIPGQTLDYTIEYENEGAGTAYGVYILDELDSNLDETTLALNDGGSYAEASRLLAWDIGEVPPGGQGEVSFSVQVRDDLASGTEIINCADVYFPSADEITPTNCVVNIVKSIAADPQSVEVTAGTPLSITLAGRDSGASMLTYRITSGPLYGTLTGIPPNVTYVSMEEFSGQDEFYFVVSNGLIESDPAKATIVVEVNPSNSTSPEVTETYPENGAINIVAGATPTSENPEQYSPTITATFSEPIDSESITPLSFMVEGLEGSIFYDAQLITAYFIPSVPLTRSTSYTARLTTAIRDKSANHMAAEYTWRFSTETPVVMQVTLPDNADEVNFGDVIINSSSEKVVSISSMGSDDLGLDTITLSGADSGEFLITEDKCSGQTVSYYDNCTVKIALSPSSAGMKSAALSIPSNYNGGVNTEITLTGTGVRKGLWSTLYSKMWGENRKSTLTTLRSFRDNVLLNNQTGKGYVRAIYRNSPEISRLMIEHPSLTEEIRHIVHDLLPGIQNLLEDNSMIVTKEQLATIKTVLDEFESKSGPDLRALIKTIKEDIRTGEMFEQLDILKED
jgi:alpha-tubulin suppressor-like RCC1 family protein